MAITPDIISTTPHLTNAPIRGRAVVIHSTRSGKSMNPSEFLGTLNWFKNPASRVSSHWVIGRDGKKARVVSDKQQAWHAGEHNDEAWGIELEQGIESDGFTPVQIDALIAVCRGYVNDFNVPVIHAVTVEQGGFIGHQETAQGRSVGKSDPGAAFPWPEILDRLKGADMKQGWHKEGTFHVLYNDDVPVLRIGSTDGRFPGRISKLFGDKHYWLRMSGDRINGQPLAVWSETEAD